LNSTFCSCVPSVLITLTAALVASSLRRHWHIFSITCSINLSINLLYVANNVLACQRRARVTIKKTGPQNPKTQKYPYCSALPHIRVAKSVRNYASTHVLITVRNSYLFQSILCVQRTALVHLRATLQCAYLSVIDAHLSRGCLAQRNTTSAKFKTKSCFLTVHDDMLAPLVANAIRTLQHCRKLLRVPYFNFQMPVWPRIEFANFQRRLVDLL
jgi:hypothetical protein